MQVIECLMHGNRAERAAAAERRVGDHLRACHADVIEVLADRREPFVRLFHVVGCGLAQLLIGALQRLLRTLRRVLIVFHLLARSLAVDLDEALVAIDKCLPVLALLLGLRRLELFGIGGDVLF